MLGSGGGRCWKTEGEGTPVTDRTDARMGKRARSGAGLAQGREGADRRPWWGCLLRVAWGWQGGRARAGLLGWAAGVSHESLCTKPLGVCAAPAPYMAALNLGALDLGSPNEPTAELGSFTGESTLRGAKQDPGPPRQLGVTAEPVR